MAQKVLVLGGILGSELWERGSFPVIDPDRKIWINPVQLLGGALARLDLAADGLSPGPLAGGASIRPGPPLSQFYGPLISYLAQAGHEVLAVGYDWRWQAIAAANGVWAQVQPWLGNQPLYIVAHSQGGLVARAVYGLMQGGGVAGQLARLICIATPHYGAWEAAWAWWRLARLYRWLLETCDRWIPAIGRAVAGLIDWVAASWPGLYELMPWRDYGPLAQLYPVQAQQLYSPSWYSSGSNPNVRPYRLSAAPIGQALLSAYLPTAVMYGIYGIGETTAVALLPGGDPGRYDGYSYTDQGDGTVTVAEGAVPGVPISTWYGSHELLPQLGGVLALVRAILAAGPGPLNV